MLLRILLLLTLLLNTSIADTIYFVVPEFKPYTYERNDSILGIGVDRVGAVMDLIGVPYTLTVVPNYGRADADMLRGEYDGLFLATENDERNSIAAISSPIIINRWCWVTLESSTLQHSDPFFKDRCRVATPLNSNTHHWLKTNGYTVSQAVADLNYLLPLLVENKVDAIFMAEMVFEALLEDSQFRCVKIEKRIESERPLGVYLSHRILESNSGLLESMNGIIENLYPQGSVQ